MQLLRSTSILHFIHFKELPLKTASSYTEVSVLTFLDLVVFHVKIQPLHSFKHISLERNSPHLYPLPNSVLQKPTLPGSVSGPERSMKTMGRMNTKNQC